MSQTITLFPQLTISYMNILHLTTCIPLGTIWTEKSSRLDTTLKIHGFDKPFFTSQNSEIKATNVMPRVLN